MIFFLVISLLSPLGEGRGPSFEIKFLLPTLPTDALCNVWLKIVLVVFERKLKMLKVYRQLDRQTTGDQKKLTNKSKKKTKHDYIHFLIPMHISNISFIDKPSKTKIYFYFQIELCLSCMLKNNCVKVCLVFKTFSHSFDI